MNPNIKKRWIEALRSGKYEQAQYSLKTSVGFCCLGVLCDLYREEKNIPSNEYWTANQARGVLPRDVAKWAEINDLDPFVAPTPNDFEDAAPLSRLNDQGATFDQIANLLETQTLIDSCNV